MIVARAAATAAAATAAVVFLADIRSLFASVDVNNDGKGLNFNEFLAATLERRELDERRLRIAFDRLDFDHSGTIDCKCEDSVLGNNEPYNFSFFICPVPVYGQTLLRHEMFKIR